jgi:diphosphomevalonate decarboxylase
VKYENPDLLFENIPTGKVGWCSPSNIALVKYWGKKGLQLPSNASISYTLNKSQTETVIDFSPSDNNKCNIDFFLEGIPNSTFANKTSEFFNRIINIFPFLNQLNIKIYSKNTFPHSAGIASSASGMSALAIALCDIENQYFESFSSKNEFFRKASYIARLGSGSACRSIYGGLVGWGMIEGIDQTSDYYGYKIHGAVNQVFDDYQDSILIIDSGQKKVSSTIGHNLMKTNPFSSGRINQANNNIRRLLEVINTGDLEEFINIVESEALSLHSMMMTSSPYFLLMKPQTISVIEEIWKYRGDTGIPVCFTLDAGPNIHLLYPNEYKESVVEFINSNLLEFTVNNNVIYDKVGKGPIKLAV